MVGYGVPTHSMKDAPQPRDEDPLLPLEQGLLLRLRNHYESAPERVKAAFRKEMRRRGT